MIKRFFEIHHKPFKDGTPRHQLLSISVEQGTREWEIIEDIINKRCLCESDEVFDYYEIYTGGDDREELATLLEKLHIIGSIWVEYIIKEVNIR
jgi:hypothetical protein